MREQRDYPARFNVHVKMSAAQFDALLAIPEPVSVNSVCTDPDEVDEINNRPSGLWRLYGG